MKKTKDTIWKMLVNELGGAMYTVRDEIIKFLINEKVIAKRADVKHLTYRQLLSKYKAACEAM